MAVSPQIGGLLFLALRILSVPSFSAKVQGGDSRSELTVHRGSLFHLGQGWLSLIAMRRSLSQYRRYQVFLNYPYDEQFGQLANAFQFSVVAAGLLPLCARDISSPDHPRLTALVDAISNCEYSAHDLSRYTGEGTANFARMNMPLEMGMALYPALLTQSQEHRCAFFVPTPHDYRAFASDLAGLDPKCHNNDDLTLLVEMYLWLRSVVPREHFNSQPINSCFTNLSSN
jgi:hypothetical protein